MKQLLVVVLFLANALVMPLVVQLFTERAPKLAIRLIKISIRFLPPVRRDRYLAEWTAELEEMERENVSQLLAAIRILLGAPSVGRVLRAQDRRRTLAERVATAGAYDAFISYTHSVDNRLASELQRALHRFAKPWYRVRGLRVFRDAANLAAGAGLWSATETAMDSSKHFILLASRAAAQSPWIAREVAHWVRHKPPHDLLVVLTDGDVVWDSARGDFDWNRTTALPATLRGVFSEAPRWLDLRWVSGESRISLANPRMLDAIATLAAPLHAVATDELHGEYVRQHQRMLRLVRLILAGAVEALLVAGLTALLIRH